MSVYLHDNGDISWSNDKGLDIWGIITATCIFRDDKGNVWKSFEGDFDEYSDIIISPDSYLDLEQLREENTVDFTANVTLHVAFSGTYTRYIDYGNPDISDGEITEYFEDSNTFQLPKVDYIYKLNISDDSSNILTLDLTNKFANPESFSVDLEINPNFFFYDFIVSNIFKLSHFGKLAITPPSTTIANFSAGYCGTCSTYYELTQSTGLSKLLTNEILASTPDELASDSCYSNIILVDPLFLPKGQALYAATSFEFQKNGHACYLYYQSKWIPLSFKGYYYDDEWKQGAISIYK